MPKASKPKKSPRSGAVLRIQGRSMCRQLGCDFECDNPECVVCPKCGSYCRAIMFPPGWPKAELAELLAAWRRGDVAPWPELLLARHAELVAPGRVQ